MSYQLLVELIEKHKIQMATSIARQAVRLKVIDGSQIQLDIEGFANSLSMIATYIRDKNIKEWQAFVEQVTKYQIARGVPDTSALEIADFMIQNINELVEAELKGPQNKAQREKFQQRVQTMHSLGQVMILVTQIKERGNLPKR